MERAIPVLYKRKEECCGCTACYAICPKEAISMVEDEEGFEYPQIDESKCVRCYQSSSAETDNVLSILTRTERLGTFVPFSIWKMYSRLQLTFAARTSCVRFDFKR